MLFLRYVGTDLDAFQKSFDRMQIADGQPVPQGQRGFLIAKFFYEEQMKLKNARRLDKIHDRLAEGKKIAGDVDLERYVKENAQQTREIVLQLDAIKTKTAVEKLQTLLAEKQPNDGREAGRGSEKQPNDGREAGRGSEKQPNDGREAGRGSEKQEADLTTLLARFFTMNDENFDARYKFFYAELAPLLELYRVKVGDTLTIKAFTRSGYVKSVNVKVYGTFTFTGIEKSPLAGTMSLMDLMSFRDLYGYLTSDNNEELKQMKAATAAKEIPREGAEDAMFGEGNTVIAEATAGVIDEKKELSGVAKTLRQEDLVRRVYNQSEVEGGVVLTAR